MPTSVRSPGAKNMSALRREGRPAYRLIPAAHFHLLTPAFDLMCALMGLGTGFAERVVLAGQVAPNARVLDAGCGTGRLARAVKARCPGADVVGLDADPHILALAGRKAARANLDVTFRGGLIEAMPFPDRSFHLVFSVLVLHHLPFQVKAAACREMFRVLRPGGRAILADFAPPHGRLAAVVAGVMRAFRLEYTADNFAGRVPGLLRDAGFTQINELFHTVWSMTCLEARKEKEGVEDKR